jgi:hypothetical protein
MSRSPSIPAAGKTAILELLRSEYGFCWENVKHNYETREKLLRLYFLVLSILISGLALLFGLTKNPSPPDPKLLFVLALMTIIIFTFVTAYRILTLRKSTISFKKRINKIRRKMLELNSVFKSIEGDEDYEYIFYLNIRASFSAIVFNGDMVLIYSLIAIISIASFVAGTGSLSNIFCTDEILMFFLLCLLTIWYVYRASYKLDKLSEQA